MHRQKAEHTHGLIRKAIPYTLILIVFFTALAVYFNTLPNGFVIDDLHQVVENDWIKDVRHIPEIFSTDVWNYEGRDSNYYRPLMYVIYMIGYHIFGLKPWGFHLINILFHAGVSILVFVITFRLLGESRAGDPDRIRIFSSFAAAVLFATHPIHTEAVTWVAGVADLSFTFFYLLSLYLYIRSTEEVDSVVKSAYLFSVVSFLLATLCKEPAITLPIILIGYDYAFRKETIRAIGSLKRYSPYMITAGLYVLIRSYALGGFAPVKTGTDLSPHEYLANSLLLFSQYIGKLLLPVNLNVWHIFQPVTSLLAPKGLLSILTTAAFVFLAWRVRKNKVAGFGLLLMVVPLLPPLYLPALTQGIENAFAERYLYLPSFGFVLLIASFIQWMGLNKSVWAAFLTIILCMSTALYAGGTIRRNADWKDSYSLWSDAVSKSPESAIAQENVGFALLYQGRTKEAKGHFEIASRLDPDLTDAFLARGIAYSNKGLIDKAILEFHAALIFRPDSVDVHYNLGLAYDTKGWLDQAIEQYRTALMLKPKYADAHNNLGISYAKKGLTDRAIEHFEDAVRLNPNDPDYHMNLARAYEIKGLDEKAKEHRQIAKALENR